MKIQSLLTIYIKCIYKLNTACDTIFIIQLIYAKYKTSQPAHNILQKVFTNLMLLVISISQHTHPKKYKLNPCLQST